MVELHGQELQQFYNIMASITITIPDAQVPRLATAVAAYRGINISSMNLAQKTAMMKQDVVTYWIERVQAAELPAVQSTAAATAVATRIADIAANITPT